MKNEMGERRRTAREISCSPSMKRDLRLATPVRASVMAKFPISVKRREFSRARATGDAAAAKKAMSSDEYTRSESVDRAIMTPRVRSPKTRGAAMTLWTSVVFKSPSRWGPRAPPPRPSGRCRGFPSRSTRSKKAHSPGKGSGLRSCPPLR